MRVDTSQAEGWWYEGSGVYRNVFLYVAEPVYIKPRKTIIKTALDGRVSVECTVVNDTPEPFCGDVVFETADIASAVHTAIAPYGEAVVKVELHIESPRLWHVDAPNL